MKRWIGLPVFDKKDYTINYKNRYITVEHQVIVKQLQDEQALNSKDAHFADRLRDELREMKSKERTEFENTPAFRRIKRWRSGIEGRLSCLKRRFGLNCSMLSGYRKTQTWTGLGILAHNLRQAAKMLA